MRARSPFTTFLIIFIAASAFAATAVATPQADAKADEANARLMVVTAEQAQVLSGPADAYYPFGVLSRGDVVKVVGEKRNLATVRIEGPAFREYYGFVRYPKADRERFRLEPGGKSGRTLGRVELLAPNRASEVDPEDSWKHVLKVPADYELIVIETFETDRSIVHKVVLPPDAEGYVSAGLLAPASKEQIAAWKAAVEGAGPRAAKEAVGAGAPLASDGVAPEHRPEVGPAGVLARDEPALPGVGVIEESEGADDATKLDEPTPLADRTAEERLADLEAAYELLGKEPIETAEVLPLRQLYLALAQDADKEKIVRYANSRAEQLAIWADLQQRRLDLNKLREHAMMTTQEAEAVSLALAAAGNYAAIGRLTASTIYDGGRLPEMFRVQDPSSGRTIAYLRRDREYDLDSLLDQIVGIVGEREYDGTLRLNVITPRQIDLLAPKE